MALARWRERPASEKDDNDEDDYLWADLRAEKPESTAVVDEVTANKRLLDELVTQSGGESWTWPDAPKASAPSSKYGRNSDTLAGVLSSFVGQHVHVIQKDGSAVEGTLLTCDRGLSLSLEAPATSSTSSSKGTSSSQQQRSTVQVPGYTIRCVHLPTGLRLTSHLLRYQRDLEKRAGRYSSRSR